MAKTIIANINLGGVAESKYSGPKNSVASAIGLDLHSVPGLIQVQQKLSLNSGSIVNELLTQKVECTNGNIFWFSGTSGNVYKTDTNGVWTKIFTTPPYGGTAACLGAAEYYGVIYWATKWRVHYITTANSNADWNSQAVTNWQAFTNGNPNYHPMLEQNLVLYIGDGVNLASIGSTAVGTVGTFVANVLTLPTTYVATCLGKIGSNLLVGTTTTKNINRCSVVEWNTWSNSFTSDIPISETAINCFIPLDEAILVSAGNNGYIYAYTGKKLSIFTRIPGTYSPTSTSTVGNASVSNRFGIGLVGISNLAGNPSLQGVWSIGSHSAGYKIIKSLEFPISTGDFSNITIGAIATINNNTYVAWQDNTMGASQQFGVDMVDYSNKYIGANFETLLMNLSADLPTNLLRFSNLYNQLPTGSSFSIAYQTEDSGIYTDMGTLEYDQFKRAYVDLAFDAVSFQIKVTLNATGNNSPTMRALVLEAVSAQKGKAK